MHLLCDVKTVESYSWQIQQKTYHSSLLPQFFANFQMWKRERNIRDICSAMNDACKRGTEGFDSTLAEFNKN